MKRELHHGRPCLVWKTEKGRVLLKATGKKFDVEVFQCDGLELKDLALAIAEALSDWGDASYQEFFQVDFPAAVDPVAAIERGG
ncbi:MAG: hypothetical protein HQ581_01185 [Planctomycetes bacterium]|nr:hypothetical protein [Planctomycetota bacterium]